MSILDDNTWKFDDIVAYVRYYNDHPSKSGLVVWKEKGIIVLFMV
jgi:hypothetical protein